MSDLAAVIPILIVTLSAVAAMVAEAFREPGERIPSGLGLIGLAGAILASVFLWGRQAEAFDVVRADNFALFVNVVLGIIGILTILLSGEIVEREQIPAGEYYALVLFGLAGMMLMAAATDLLVIFIALEIFSLSVYVLTGIRRTSAAGAEASFKYFLLGAFSSAFFLYGIALTFAQTGSTRLADLVPLVARQAMDPSLLALLGVGLLMVGFAFKVSAVPFHMWTPDAYQGAPTIVTGFMSTAVKAAAFAAFVRVFVPVFGPLSADWVPLLWWIAVLTMIVGTVVGVVQTNVKRMLAYSSIAHAGYILVGVIAAGLARGDSETGMAAVLFYLLAYAVTNLGAFGVVALLATREHPHDELKDFTGLWYRRPGLAALMAVFLLSLGGFPPTAGFIAKWYIFYAAVLHEQYALAIIGVLSSVVSVFFYLRIIVMMYMTEQPAEAPQESKVPRLAMAALSFAVVAIFYLGVLPTQVLDIATQSVGSIFWR
jgi:NADH-quinone oxidoreductase subunit N